MILLIDNYDSFTYNLCQLIGRLGFDVVVKKHDEITLEEIEVLKPERIIISPGPKRPEDAGVSMDVINHFYKTIPILGVCLGHQCIGQLFGTKVVHAKEVLHGKTSEVSHGGKGIFEGIKNPFLVARYHSLAIEKVPEEFNLRAWTNDKEIMAIQHKKYSLYGIQFHPESFMTDGGDKLMNNFLSIKS
ncbi:MAG TPA: aminodeoxychorismate/anthranilate synthase component II [Candidatus Jorgensenbacteria bacterium]|nr:aminodeoxychorismate/anthranilate synthase component II [Candidatus Jorgensenbacteria bacterium]